MVMVLGIPGGYIEDMKLHSCWQGPICVQFAFLVSLEPCESRGFGFVTFAHPAKIEEVLAAGKDCTAIAHAQIQRRIDVRSYPYSQ